MSGKVIERTKGKNEFEYIDTPSTFEKAERISGNLDKRGSYCIIDGEVLRASSFIMPCSGCSPDDPYVLVSAGCGCRECGGTGKRKVNMFLPIKKQGGE